MVARLLDILHTCLVEIRRLGALCLLSALASLPGACASHEQHPPQLGDCTGSANACLGTHVGSGAANASSTSDGGKCGSFTYPEPCGTCVETNCCSLVGLCSNNAACFTVVVSCIPACTTQSCIDDCRTSQPGGTADLDALYQCLGTSCASACTADDAGTGAENDATTVGQSCGRLTYQSVTCQTCVEGGCCDAAEMCSSDPDCFVYIQCLAGCGSADPKCVANCQTTYPMGAANATHFEQCVQDKCAAQCR
jgi:hypothetical protein